MGFQWKKLGKIFDPTTVNDRYFIQQYAQAPSTLVFDNFVRVYFSCRPLPDARGLYTSFSAYLDLDRRDLFKILHICEEPILRLGDLGTFDEFGTYPVSVIKQNERFLAFYGGWTRCESVPFNVAIGLATSYDEGKTFVKLGTGPVLSYSSNEPFILSGPKIRWYNNQYFLFYIAGKEWILDDGKPEPIYKIRMATSMDGINWNKVNRDLIAPILEENEAQASPDVFFSKGKYHMFFSYRYSTGFRSKLRGYRIGYAYSTDLLNWHREDEKAGLNVSADGCWDSESVSYPHIFELDGNIFMMYQGNEVGKYGFGIAKLENSLT